MIDLQVNTFFPPLHVSSSISVSASIHCDWMLFKMPDIVKWQPLIFTGNGLLLKNHKPAQFYRVDLFFFSGGGGGGIQFQDMERLCMLQVCAKPFDSSYIEPDLWVETSTFSLVSFYGRWGVAGTQWVMYEKNNYFCSCVRECILD